MTARFRARQAWTIAKIELRRAFLSKRAFWVYALALFPAVIFFGHSVELKYRYARFSARGVTPAAVIDAVNKGDTEDEVLKRTARPVNDWRWVERNRRAASGPYGGITVHPINATPARFVRLNIITPTQTNDTAARIYEFEVYGPGATANLALNRPAISSTPCIPEEGPEKAFNGNTTGGDRDKWCSRDPHSFLQVDLGSTVPVNRFVLKHAQTGREGEELNTAAFNIQVSTDGTHFSKVVDVGGDKQVKAQKITHRTVMLFDGRRQAQFSFTDGVLTSKNIRTLRNFEEDRLVFAGVFQYFYLRLAIFFGCLGIFMNLFRGEMLDKTLHYWFLAPARRDVLLAGKYIAGLIAAAVIFTTGAMLCFGIMLWTNEAAEVQAYWQGPGPAHAFWYAAATLLGCVGYGSVFLAAGLLLRNPIIPAAILLVWENISSFLPALMQKMTVLYYLQSLCPVAVPVDNNAPPLIRLLLAPATPASRLGSVLGLLILTAVVLWIASIAVRRIQISYGTE